MGYVAGGSSEGVGDKRPGLVFVPGLGLDAREWDGVRRCLREHGVPDDESVVLLPSLGHPAAREVELHVEALAERLVERLVEAVRDSKRGVVLVGHSASCPVVVETAARCASVVGLVLIGPVTDPRAATWPRMVARWLRTAVHERLWEIPVLVPQYSGTGLGSIVRGMNAMRSFRSDRAVARTSAPVAIVRGSRDRIAPYDWCRQLVRAAAGPGSVTSVPGAGHMVPLTHPQAVAVAIRAVQSEIVDSNPR
jgi:pimeloyl-ACP methyl ester carboxylesterase